MRPKYRLRVGFATLLTLFATAAFALLSAGGPASADTPATPQGKPDPQTTNVPYLAWAGEQIRMEKCLPTRIDESATSTFDFSLIRAEFLVEDWSGDPGFKPQIEDPTVKLFFAVSNRQVYFCAAGDAISLDPGMARIELDITDNAGVLGLPGLGPANPVLKHQFLAGWMTLNDPSLKEMAASDFPNSAQANAAGFLGDPSGNGHFTAGGNPGILDVNVTGSMPMNGNWSGLIGKSSVTLPNDWPLLAGKLATDSNPQDANPANRWDIHDDELATEGHVPSSGCPVTDPSLKVDAVDNCYGSSNDTGPFSTVFGASSQNTVGPFDQVRPNDTLLSDGKLDSADAPMPAARIDVGITPNSGGSTDTTGVGYLSQQSKDISYSRDFTVNGTAHNLYAPFYNAWLPATGAGDVSSGIDGPSSGNNFAGFLNYPYDPYHFWDIADTLSSSAGGATSCLERSRNPQTDSPTANPSDYYQNPSGASTVAVYTDEHGEAQVQWNPGSGFYFNSLINSGAAITNANGGCDLQNLYRVVGGLGSANLTATARYPYKPVDFSPTTSNAVSKDAMSLWSKTLAYYPKGVGSANGNARIVVAHAQNIDGSPFAGEKVCFFADSNSEGMQIFQGTVGGISYAGTSKAGSDPLCVYTDRNGNAAVEVFDSNANTVNVIAEFVNEGILRDIGVNFASSAGGGTPPPTPGAPGTAPTKSGTNSGTTPPSSTVLNAVAPVLVTTNTPAVHNSAQIKLARLVRPAHGRHYVMVRINSRSKTVRIRLRMTKVSKHLVRGSNGRRHLRSTRTTHTVTVSVATNRTVKITVPNAVVTVRVLL